MNTKSTPLIQLPEGCFIQQAAGQLLWGHNLVLLDKLNNKVKWKPWKELG